jgi:hypothetical protein
MAAERMEFIPEINNQLDRVEPLNYSTSGPIRQVRIGSKDYPMENLSSHNLGEDGATMIWYREIEEWCRNNSTDKITYRVTMQENLSWTSVVFDFIIYAYKPTSEVPIKMYLLDNYKFPEYYVCSGASMLLRHPKVLRFLRSKLFKFDGRGIELRNRFRICPELRHPDKPHCPLPINAAMIKAMQRDYYFNNPLNYSVCHGVHRIIHCEYRVLSLHGVETFSKRISNLIHTGIVDREFNIAPIGPSWFCTLNQFLKDEGKNIRIARMYNEEGDWRSFIQD